VRSAVSLKNNDGFTLVEVMVAIVIMTVGLLGLLQTIGVAFEHNLRNELREQAVNLGEKYINDLKGKSFDSYSVSPGYYSPLTVTSTVRGVAGRTYTVEREVQNIGDVNNKQLQVTVRLTYKNAQYQNRVSTPISRVAP
jgi:type IV pilus assembly protein PilV